MRADLVRLLAVLVFSSLLFFIFINFNPVPARYSFSFKKDKVREIAKDISDRCRNKQATCWEDGIEKELLERYSLPMVFDAIYDWDRYFSCHAFTHFIGRDVYKRTRSIPDSYAAVNYTCHGGAFHGVMEAFLDERKQTLDKLGGDEIEKICKSSKSLIRKEPDMIYYECFHGFGHAFMFVTNENLPVSLEYCDRLNEVPFREACYGGSLMENSTSSTSSDHKSVWLSESDKFYPCTILQDKYLNQCYFYQANYLLMKTNRNFEETFKDCYRLDVSSHYDYCILGIGAQLASVSNEQGMERAGSVCGIAQGDAKLRCIEGAVPSIFDRYGGKAQKPLEFCTLVADDLQEYCFGKVGNVASRWKADVDKICQSVQNYSDACLGKKGFVYKY